MAVGTLVLFLLLAGAGSIQSAEPGGLMPWHPLPALAIAVLLLLPRLLWAVPFGLLAGQLLLHGPELSAWAVLVLAMALFGSYALSAAALRNGLSGGRFIREMRDVAVLLIVVASGALAATAALATVLALSGSLAELGAARMLLRFWLGEALGMLVPLSTLLALRDEQAGAVRRLSSRDPQVWLIAAAAALVPIAVFGFARSTDQGLDFSFLILLPVVWAALRLGTHGAVLAASLAQIGLVFVVQFVQQGDRQLFEVQLLITTISVTALLLGVVVNQRLKAIQELRDALRVAAAGEVSAALAHELRQPLAALAAYGEAYEMADAAADRAQVARRMASDARRAGALATRLLAFFRSGDTARQPLSLEPLLRDALAAHARRAEALGIAMHLVADPGLPLVEGDPMQLSVVVRNLIGNALDALQQHDSGSERSVTITVAATRSFLRVSVIDSGPGVPPEMAEEVFRHGWSGKRDGAGVGLAICRRIVEAHGGSLGLVPGPNGQFLFTLPINGNRLYRRR